MNRENYDSSRRISIAYFGDKGIIFTSPWKGVSPYMCVGKNNIAFADTFQEAWHEWAKRVKVGPYELYKEEKSL